MAKAKEEPPYLKIAAELRRRIATGALKPGERLPSTRQVTEDWGVAMATATKALTALREEGVIVSVPRVGSVVAPAAQVGLLKRSGSSGLRVDTASDTSLDQARIVAIAIEIADSEGLNTLSMRGLAAKLEAPVMSLYRHVRNREELVLLMTDAAFAEQPLPEAAPPGWRASVEFAARRQWFLYRQHPWLAQVMTLTRPLPLKHVIAYADWALSALDGVGLDSLTIFNAHLTAYSFVRGIAINLEWERQAEAETGLTDAEWTEGQLGAFGAILASGEVPTFARLMGDLVSGFDMDLDAVFEFSLVVMLDGLAELIRRKGGER